MEENRESGHIEKQLAYPSKKEAYTGGSPSTDVLKRRRQVQEHFARSGDGWKTERAGDAATSWNAKPVSIDLARMLPYWCIRLAPTKLILRYSLRTDTRASLFAFVPYTRVFKRDADNWLAVCKQPRYRVSVKIRRCSVPCIPRRQRSTKVSFCL